MELLTPYIRRTRFRDRVGEKYAGSPAIAELLVQRGITSVDDAEHFFNPSLSDLHDPFLMKDMDKAVDRLNMAMGAKRRYWYMEITMSMARQRCLWYTNI